MIEKAITFANICLGYTGARAVKTAEGTIIRDGTLDRCFNTDSISDLQRVLGEFLCKNYWLQFNYEPNDLFQWTALVGQKNLIDKRASFEHGKGAGNIAEAAFDACIAAKVMDKRVPVDAVGEVTPTRELEKS